MLVPPAVLGLSNTDVGRRWELLGQQSASTDKQAQRGEMRRYIRQMAREELGGRGADRRFKNLRASGEEGKG